MTKIKKGTPVYLIRSWDDKATVYVQTLIVDSFGKRQGTAHSIENGQMLKVHIRPDQIGQTLFAVADVEDLQTLAHQKAVDLRQSTMDRLQYILYRTTHYSDDHPYIKAIKKDLAEVTAAEPKAIFR